jgi:ribulose-phosphate 3-epimerase
LRIAASIVCADQLRLGEVVDVLVETGVDELHVDVLDGRFAPNFGIGFRALEALAQLPLPLDVHLMVVEPERFVPALAERGVDMVTFHVESSIRPHHLLGHIRECGMQAGLACNPATPLQAIRELVDDVDRLLLMSVDPGFEGQAFLGTTIRRVERVARYAGLRGLEVDVAVDGGIGLEEIPQLRCAGATTIVVGTHALFTSGRDLRSQALRLRRLCDAPEQWRGHDRSDASLVPAATKTAERRPAAAQPTHSAAGLAP